MDLEKFMIKRIESLMDVPTGTVVSAIINGDIVPEAKIQREQHNVFGDLVILCQNEKQGHMPKDTMGYSYGWHVGNGSPDIMRREGVEVFEHGYDLTEYLRSKKELEAAIAKKAEEEKKRVLEEKVSENKGYFVHNVLKYLKNNNNTPLTFRYYDDGREMSIESEDDIYLMFNLPLSLSYEYFKSLSGVDKMVYACLALARWCYSSAGEHKETVYGRKRSSIDIWRHIIKTHPETNIFQVMQSLYMIGDDYKSKMKSWFCSTVDRQVFHVGGRLSKDQAEQVDEYENLFYNWQFAEKLYEDYKRENETTKSGKV